MEALFMSRFRVIVVAAIAAAGLAIGAAPALAGTHPSDSAVRSVSQAGGPRSHCPRGGTEATIYNSSCGDATALNHASCSRSSGKMPFSPPYIFNGCGKRVWLFTGDLTGTKVCINPGTGNNGAFGPSYKYYQITNNPDNC
jgi:hypothetical protein